MFDTEKSWADSAWWAFVTLCLMGYGPDNAPIGRKGRLAALIYMPMAFSALTRALEELRQLYCWWNVRSWDYEKIADQLLLQEARGESAKELNEAEWVLAVLTAQNIVDEPTVDAVKIQFAQMMRTRDQSLQRVAAATGNGAAASGGGRVIDAQTIFSQLVKEDKVQQRPEDVVGHVPQQ